jgi:hypothetical protein
MSQQRTYRLCHLVNIRRGSIVHHRIGEHQSDVTMILKRVGYLAVAQACLDCFEVYWSSHYVSIVGRIALLNGLVKYCPRSVVPNAGVKASDQIDKLFVDSSAWPSSSRTCVGP